MRIKYVFLSFFLLTLFTVQSQHLGPTLSKKDALYLKKKAKRKVKQLGFMFKKLAEVKYSAESKQIKAAMIKKIMGEFIHRARVEIAWINKKTKDTIKKRLPIRKYLNSLTKYSKTHKMVNVSIVNISIESKLTPDPKVPGAYRIHYKYTQMLVASREGKDAEGMYKINYIDTTEKKGYFLIKRVSTALGNKWKMFYGDISVVKIKS